MKEIAETQKKILTFLEVENESQIEADVESLMEIVTNYKYKGAHLQKNAIGMKRKAMKEFAAVGNPGTRVFVEKMEDMIQIYNHTSQICFDREKMYLLV